VFLSKYTAKKGVSPVIAVVLMIAVAVSIAVIVYAWSTGFISKRSSVESAEVEKLVIENMNLSGTSLTLYVRNQAHLGCVLDTIYVNGQMRANDCNVSLPSTQLIQLDLTSIVNSRGGDGTFIIGDQVQMVTLRGTQINFQVK
jgi:flagellin-like protein